MNILFHDNSLTERGTTVAVFDYADYSEKLLGHCAYIAYRQNDPNNNSQVISKFKRRFGERVIAYENFNDLNYIARNSGIEFCYLIKAGENDGKLIKGIKNGVHAVFQRCDPHGDRYAYVSDWLSLKMSARRIPSVPHIVALPTPEASIRRSLGIPPDAFVVGRIGGFDQFNIDFAKVALVNFMERFPSSWFVAVNTRAFFSHPRIIYLPPIISPIEKSNFIDSCNIMLHARKEGESFGIAIAEFLSLGKPVLTWGNGIDLNHTQMVPKEFIYSGADDLFQKLRWLKIDYSGEFNKEIKDSVVDFNPGNVMDRFDQIFLKN